MPAPKRAVFVALLLLLAVAARGTEILHLDLRQPGSATIILQPTPAGLKTIVIDFGKDSNDRAVGGWRVLESLRALREGTILHVDLAVATHTDSDHLGGVAHLLTSEHAEPSDKTPEDIVARGPPAMPIRAMLLPRWTPVTKLGRRMIALAAARTVTQFTPRETATAAEFENELGIRVFAAESPRTTNDSSIVVAVFDSERSGVHLITGDVTRRSWREIAPQLRTLGQPVLSVTAPHHGGDAALLDIVDDLRPETIIFSANRDNPYRHPSLKLFRELARRNPAWRLRAVEGARQHAIAQDEMILQLRTEIVEAVYDGMNSADKRAIRMSVYGDYTFDGPADGANTQLSFEAEHHTRLKLGMSESDWKQFRRWQAMRQRSERESTRSKPAHDSATDSHRKEVDVFVTRAQKDAWAAGTRLRNAQLRITGDLGDVKVDAPPSEQSALDQFFAEATFRHIAHLSDREVDVLKTVPRARAYCLLKVHADLANLEAAANDRVAPPAWSTEYELLIKELFPDADRVRVRAYLLEIAKNTRADAIAPFRALGKQADELFKLHKETIAEARARRDELRQWMHDAAVVHRKWVEQRIRNARPGERLRIPAPVLEKAAEVSLPDFPEPMTPHLELPPSARTFNAAAIDPARDPLVLFDQGDYQRRVEAARVREIQHERFRAEKRLESETRWREAFEARRRSRR